MNRRVLRLLCIGVFLVLTCVCVLSQFWAPYIVWNDYSLHSHPSGIIAGKMFGSAQKFNIGITSAEPSSTVSRNYMMIYHALPIGYVLAVPWLWIIAAWGILAIASGRFIQKRTTSTTAFPVEVLDHQTKERKTGGGSIL